MQGELARTNTYVICLKKRCSTLEANCSQLCKQDIKPNLPECLKLKGDLFICSMVPFYC